MCLIVVVMVVDGVRVKWSTRLSLSFEYVRVCVCLVCVYDSYARLVYVCLCMSGVCARLCFIPFLYASLPCAIRDPVYERREASHRGIALCLRLLTVALVSYLFNVVSRAVHIAIQPLQGGM